MASPFRVFRKHQKALMAVAVVVAMFVFVIGDALFQYVGQTATGVKSPRATVVSWSGGSINAQELEMLVQRRYFISDFLRQIEGLGVQRIFAEGGNPVPASIPRFILPENQPSRDVGLSVVRTRLMADQARRAGFEVGDDVINHYIREAGLRRVGDEDMIGLLSRYARGGRSMEDQLFSGLRELLLADHYLSGYRTAMENVLPEERWEDWKRINHRISVDAAILPASAFLDNVPAPTEADLLAFYEQHKDRIAGIPRLVMGAELPSPAPGFAEPRRVKLNYMTADVNARADDLLDSITDEEIAEFYEENKDTMFVQTSTAADFRSFDELFPDELQDEPAPEDFDTEPADTETEPTEGTSSERPQEDVGETDTDEAIPTDPVEPATGATDEADETLTEAAEESAETDRPERDELFDDPIADEEAASEESTTDSAHSDEAHSDEAHSDDAAVENDGEQPGDGESSHLLRQSPFRLAAFQDNDETENQDANAEVEKPADDAATAEQTETEEAPAPEEDTTAIDESDPAEDADATTADEDEPVDYVPLEEVEDTIRMRLATVKAAEEIGRVFRREIAELRAIYSPYSVKVITARSEGGELPEPPEELTQLSDRAKALGLISEETVLLSQEELRDTFVGQAINAETQRESVAQAVFRTLPLYEPYLAQEHDGTQYLVLKTEDEPARVPEYEEVKDDVLAAWRTQESRKLAAAAAEEFAKECQETGESLDGFFTGKPYEVVTTDMFSWLTFGATPVELQRGPRLGEAPPLRDVGPDFMVEAFKLDAEDVASVTNFDGSQAYVIRLARRERTEQELRDQFLAEANNWPGWQIMRLGRIQSNEMRIFERLTERLDLDEEMLDEYFGTEDDEF